MPSTRVAGPQRCMHKVPGRWDLPLRPPIEQVSETLRIAALDLVVRWCGDVPGQHAARAWRSERVMSRSSFRKQWCDWAFSRGEYESYTFHMRPEGAFTACPDDKEKHVAWKVPGARCFFSLCFLRLQQPALEIHRLELIDDQQSRPSRIEAVRSREAAPISKR